MNRLHQRLLEHLDELVEVLGHANRNIDKEELRAMLYELLLLAEEEASYIYSRQYQESIDQYDKIYVNAYCRLPGACNHPANTNIGTLFFCVSLVN